MIELSLLNKTFEGICRLKGTTLPKISELIDGYPVLSSQGNLENKVSSIVCDSRKAIPGSLFVAIPGIKSDGSAFIVDAVQRGAVAVLTEGSVEKMAMLESLQHIAGLQIQNGRNALAFLSCRFYKYPSKKLDLIGITGTNGKTTVTYLLESIFKSKSEPVGVLGTISYRFGKEERIAPMTTPESPDINQMLAEMVDREIHVCLMEVSSHALTHQRVRGLDFAVTVFTNLSRDHLDFHDNLQHYIQSKKSLFKNHLGAKRVVNVDDALGREIVQEYPEDMLTAGIDQNADVKAENLILDENGCRFNLVTPQGSCSVQSPLLGKHNVYNMLSAIGAALQLNISLETIVQGIQSLKRVPGRFDRIDLGQDFTVAIDYAHTDDALLNVLKAAREFVQNRVILVFGCGGDRDRGKRLEMGRIAVENSNYTIITSDNPRSENPDQIIQDICSGLPVHARENDHYLCIADRKEAIAYAIQKARPGDMVLIAGKGHEDYQILNTGRIHFDDREVAQSVLKQRLNLD